MTDHNRAPICNNLRSIVVYKFRLYYRFNGFVQNDFKKPRTNDPSRLQNKDGALAERAHRAKRPPQTNTNQGHSLNTVDKIRHKVYLHKIVHLRSNASSLSIKFLHKTHRRVPPGLRMKTASAKDDVRSNSFVTSRPGQGRVIRLHTNERATKATPGVTSRKHPAK